MEETSEALQERRRFQGQLLAGGFGGLLVRTAGTYQWLRVIPCDSDAHGAAMNEDGWMAGTITAS